MRVPRCRTCLLQLQKCAMLGSVCRLARSQCRKERRDSRVAVVPARREREARPGRESARCAHARRAGRCGTHQTLAMPTMGLSRSLGWSMPSVAYSMACDALWGERERGQLRQSASRTRAGSEDAPLGRVGRDQVPARTASRQPQTPRRRERGEGHVRVAVDAVARGGCEGRLQRVAGRCACRRRVEAGMSREGEERRGARRSCAKAERGHVGERGEGERRGRESGTEVGRRVAASAGRAREGQHTFCGHRRLPAASAVERG